MISASSVTAYDNWGNVIYTEGPTGQQNWYSYANTNSQNTFGTTGFSDAFYTNNSISSNIHDVLVGQADWQNGAGSGGSGTLALDGTAACDSGSSNTCTMSLTTSHSNDVIIVISAAESSGGVGPFALTSDTAGLTYHNRAQICNYGTCSGASGSGAPVVLREDYAIATSPLSSDTITCKQTGNTNSKISCVAYAISGANTASPFDSNVAAPCTGYSGNGVSSSTFSCTLSTSDADDMIIGDAAFGSVTASVGSGFTFAKCNNGDGEGSACSEYKVVSSTQSGLSVSMSGSSSTLWAFIGDAVQAASGTGVPQETYYNYNSFGELLTQKELHSGGWIYTTYTYDHYGNEITMTNALGTTTHYHYSSTYNHAYLTLTSTMVGSANITQSYTYSSTTGYMLSETDGNGHTTSYSYDGLGRTTEISDPSVGGVSAVTTYVYNDPSNYVTITNPNGNVVKQYYDGLGRLTSVQTYNGSSIYSTESYTYAWDNQVATDTLPSGAVYHYHYNQDGQQVEIINPDGTTIITSYDLAANSKTVTDENGHPTVYTYDWDGRLLSVEQYYTSTSFYTTSYTYDLSRNLLSLTDANGATTSYTYNDLNELVKTTYPGSSHQTQSYNSVGDMTGMVNQGGTQLNYTYDALNRLTQVTYPGGSTQTYTYDNDGNILTETNSAVSTYYKYDSLDRPTNETQVVSGTKSTVLYGYDDDGNIKSMVYPGGTNVTMAYDFLNRLSKVGYPAYPTSLAKISYTKDSLLGSIAYGDGENVTYSYNSMDRPTQIDLKLSDGVKRMDLNYTYDGDGNVLTENTQSFGYNWLDELASASGPWGTTTYAYDPAGNMLNQTTGSDTTKYSYGTYNELESIGRVNFTYDSFGNTHTIDNGSTLWTYSYNYNNQLDQVEKNSATVATYTYDGNGMLVKSVEADTQVFAYQGDSMLYAKNTGTGSSEDYVYADGMALASVNGSTTDYYHEDALGSVMLVSSSSATTLFSTSYKPYGDQYGWSGTATFTYTGKADDTATSLDYSGARWYDPASERFMTQDSYGGKLSVPLSLNRYIYSLDDPLKYTDPTGYYSVTTTSYTSITFYEDTPYGVESVDVEEETTTTTEYTFECTSAKTCSYVETGSSSSTTPVEVTLTMGGQTTSYTLGGGVVLVGRRTFHLPPTQMV